MSLRKKIRSLWKNKSKQADSMKWLGYYSKPFLPKLILIVMLDTLMVAVGLGMALLSKKIIDSAGAGLRDSVFLLIPIYLGLIVITQVFQVVQGLVKTMLSERFSFSIRKKLYERILYSVWQKTQRFHTGDLMTRLTSDAGTISDGVISTVPEMITLLVELIMVFFTLFYYSPLLAIFALVTAPTAVLVSWWLGKKLKKLQVKVQESEAAYRSFLQESMANLLIVKAFSNEEYAAEKLVKLREERFFWVFKKAKYGTFSSAVMSMAFQLGYIAAFTYGALEISEGLITYGTMSIFLTLVNRVQSPIMQLAYQIPRVVSVFASMGRVMELQTLPLEEKTEEMPLKGALGVRTENLDFAYEEDIVLKDVNLDVKPGETVAIVGESGIGKTTLIRLLMSFTTPDKGTITFYDKNGLTEPASAAGRRFIAYVPQGNTLISGSIRENILMGNHEADEAKIRSALERAACLKFVEHLPQGLDTVIGEKGYGLSEGQAQRIAIARALVRDAQLLIMDEATSALDEATELEVLRGIHAVKEKNAGKSAGKSAGKTAGKTAEKTENEMAPTCLVITHRRSVLQYCDREIKLK